MSIPYLALIVLLISSYLCLIFFYQVRYLDCLDFGIKNVCHTTPRVLVWKGDMIQSFSELDRKSPHQFGKKLLKETRTAGQHPTVSFFTPLFCYTCVLAGVDFYGTGIYIFFCRVLIRFKEMYLVECLLCCLHSLMTSGLKQKKNLLAHCKLMYVLLVC